MKPKIDANKKYTSCGHPVEHLHRAPDGWPDRFPWRGIVDGCEQTWSDEGEYGFPHNSSQLDLIEVREPLQFQCIVNNKGERFTLGDGVAYYDTAYPLNAPHRLVKFREVIE